MLEEVVDDPVKADALTQEVLAKAFRGDLVPTAADLARAEGRAYAPASALLDRLRAEPASQAGSGNQGQRQPRRNTLRES